MNFKPGVSTEGLSLEMFSALPLVEAVFAEFDIVCVMTAGKEHRAASPPSLHPSGNAADFRAHQVNPFVLPTMRERLKAKLGKGYDVVVEIFYPDISRTHVHVEWDPK